MLIVVCSHGASEVIYPIVEKHPGAEALSVTPLHKTLRSYVESLKPNSTKRFSPQMSDLLHRVVKTFSYDITLRSLLVLK